MKAQRQFDVVDKPLFITSSLIDQVAFHAGFKPGSEWKTKSLLDLKAQLKRNNTFTQTDFTERGQAFEDKLCAFARLPLDKFRNAFEHDVLCDISKLDVFYNALQGAETQKEMKGKFEIDGQMFTFYGKADIVQYDTAGGKRIPKHHADIKTTSSWKPTGAYASDKAYKQRAQHLMYMFLDKVPTFDYLIAEFIDQNGGDDRRGRDWRVIDVHTVPIAIPDRKELEEKLYTRILDAVNFFAQDAEMWADYCNVFTRTW